MKITAPFTIDQVNQLTKHQSNPQVHPYTCGGCEPCRVLNVTSDGLKCCFCNHNQQWAWGSNENADMANKLSKEVNQQRDNGYIIMG